MNGFNVRIYSDLEYENLIADIYYEDQCFATLTTEEGFENMMIKIHKNDTENQWVFRFDESEDAINYARNLLRERYQKKD